MKCFLIALGAVIFGFIVGMIIKHRQDSRLIDELMKELEADLMAKDIKIELLERTINQLEATVNRHQVFKPSHCRAPETKPIEWQELNFPNSAKGEQV